MKMVFLNLKFYCVFSIVAVVSAQYYSVENYDNVSKCPEGVGQCFTNCLDRCRGGLPNGCEVHCATGFSAKCTSRNKRSTRGALEQSSHTIEKRQNGRQFCGRTSDSDCLTYCHPACEKAAFGVGVCVVEDIQGAVECWWCNCIQ